jgi:multisubunit Na+/H+ antiporter MnhB subunit
MSLLPDLVLVLLILIASVWSVAARDRRDAVIGFIVVGLLLSLAWMRVNAVDVALTEAAVGGGATGLLLLRACARLGPVEAEGALPGAPLRLVTGLLCLVIFVGLAAVVVVPVEPPPSLAPAVAASMGELGLGNPVTVVLLAYRALDTLLEKVVLVLALIGVWALSPGAFWGGAPASLRAQQSSGALTFLAQVLPPVGVVIGVYLVWNGADRPGGTFQGGTVLAAMWLLVMMAGLRDPPEIRLRKLRLLVVFGPVLFLVAGFAGFWMADGFLSYPPGAAKPIIVGVEAALALSIAVILGMLVAGPPAQPPRSLPPQSRAPR